MQNWWWTQHDWWKNIPVKFIVKVSSNILISSYPQIYRYFGVRKCVSSDCICNSASISSSWWPYTYQCKIPRYDDDIKWKIFGVTGTLWGESTGHRWIPLTKANDAELWYFLWSAPEQTVDQNNRYIGYLRRHRAHYGVTVMFLSFCSWPPWEDYNRTVSSLNCVKNQKWQIMQRTAATEIMLIEERIWGECALGTVTVMKGVRQLLVKRKHVNAEVVEHISSLFSSLKTHI